MSPVGLTRPSRRGFLTGAGALIVTFSWPFSARAADAPAGLKLPVSLEKTPMIDAWIRIDADGAISVFTGKAELGQGIKTALIQVAAEELMVEPAAIHLVTADTALTPDEGYTAGSHSMQDSGTAIRNAAAQARVLLIGAAAARLQLPQERLQAEGGAVIADDGRRLGYGELVGDQLLHVTAQSQSDLVKPGQYRLIGKPVPRGDIPAKVVGEPAYVQDLRLPGMVHARVVRPPSYRAVLRRFDTEAVANMPGVIIVHHDGNYLAVIAEREYQAVMAMRALAAAAEWDETVTLPQPAQVFDWLVAQPSQQVPVRDDAVSFSAGAQVVEATYLRCMARSVHPAPSRCSKTAV
jgi:nicotinate dehydrogenase subunit B